jgi:ankyrin repeat protein
MLKTNKTKPKPKKTSGTSPKPSPQGEKEAAAQQPKSSAVTPDLTEKKVNLGEKNNSKKRSKKTKNRGEKKGEKEFAFASPAQKVKSTSEHLAIDPTIKSNTEKERKQKIQIAKLKKKYSSVFKEIVLAITRQSQTQFSAAVSQINERDKWALPYLFEHHDVNAPINAIGSQNSLKHTLVAAACHCPDPALVLELITFGASVNVPDASYVAPINIAVTQCKVKLVHILVEAGADVNQYDAQMGTFPLFNICYHNALTRTNEKEKAIQIAKILIAAPNINVNLIPQAPFDNFVSPLAAAVLKNAPGIAAMLLGKNADVNYVDCYQRTPLHYLFHEGFAGRIDQNNLPNFIKMFLKLFLQKNARIDLPTTDDSFGVTLIRLNNHHLFSLVIKEADLNNDIQRNNRLFFIKQLAKCGMSINKEGKNIFLVFPYQNYQIDLLSLTQEEKDYLLFMLAQIKSSYSQQEVAIALLENGANPNSSLLMSALNILSKSSNSDVKLAPDDKDSTISVLCLAIYNWKLWLIETLLKNNANPNLCVKSLSPLYSTISGHHDQPELLQIVELLLLHGADVNHLVELSDSYIFKPDQVSRELALDRVGNYKSVLGLAIDINREDIVTVLLKAGADPFLEKVRDKKVVLVDGCNHLIYVFSPFKKSVSSENLIMASLLLEHADKKILEQADNLFVFLAKNNTNLEILRLFLNKYFHFLMSTENQNEFGEKIMSYSRFILLVYTYSLSEQLDLVLNYAQENLPEKTHHDVVLFNLMIYLYLSDDVEKTLEIVTRYNVEIPEIELMDKPGYNFNDWLEGKCQGHPDFFDDSEEIECTNTERVEEKIPNSNLVAKGEKEIDIKREKEVENKSSALAGEEVPVLQLSDQVEGFNLKNGLATKTQFFSCFDRSPALEKPMSSRQYLRSMGFDDVTIKELAKLNKEKKVRMRMEKELPKTGREGFFAKTKSVKSKNESWFEDLLLAEHTEAIINKINCFLWIPEGLFEEGIKELFSKKTAKAGEHNIKFINDAELNAVTYVIEANQKQYQLNFCAEIKIHGLARLMVFKYNNLHIALHYLEEGLHTKEDKKNFISTHGRCFKFNSSPLGLESVKTTDYRLQYN